MQICLQNYKNYLFSVNMYRITVAQHMDRNIKILQEFGLSHDEAGVYLASLSIGPASILRISQVSGVTRTSVYRVFDSLSKMGLMRLELKGLKKLYASENPENLKRILEWKNQKLETLLPDLLSAFSKQGKNTLMKYYDGIEGVKSVYEMLVRDTESGEPYYVISSHIEWYDLDKKWFEKFSEKRNKRGFDFRFMLLDSEYARLLQKRQSIYHQQIKILPKNLHFTSVIIITPQRILVHNLTQPVEGLVIENSNIIEMFFQVFNLLWQTAGTSSMKNH